MRAPRQFLWLATALGASACIGSIGDDGHGPDSDDPFVEDESAIGASDLRRLSSHEYEATLRDLFGDTDVDQVTAAIGQVPKDSGGKDFSTMSQGVSAVHVDGYYTVAAALSDFYGADPARLAPVASCFASAADQACVEGFVDDFGRRVFRRPVTSDERAALVDLYQQGSALSEGDGLRLVLLYLLQAAPFLYRLELDGAAAPELEAVYQLTSWELATRMAYFAWGSTPDEALLDAAADGSLLTADGYEAQLTRLLGDDRARDQVRRFFLEWLGVDAVPQVQQPDTFLAGIDGSQLAADMQEEIARFVEHQVFEQAASYADLLISDETFVTSPELAAVYGLASVPPPDQPVSLGPERAGLLTRPALLLGNGVTTHPIRRGAHLRELMLCQILPVPNPADFPPNAIADPPFDAAKTSRERWTAQTEPGNCAVCHDHINPFGFALEHFDTIGRYRELESIVDPVTSEEVNELPIDAEVELNVDGPKTANGASALSALLATSETAQSCFARQWFRYAMGREEGGDDEALLRGIGDAVAENTLLETMKRLAL
ncbi:MAG: DUF1592 domain-containing protein, partial [Myxococcales bacterium]|nr:DUF1592 domain-containing protein [Myxococcales bacterium]